MQRLTVRDGDIVYFKKDGALLPPAIMSSYDIRMALMRLAELEEKIERMEQMREAYLEKYTIRNNGVSCSYPDIQFNEDGGFNLEFKSDFIE